MKTLHPASFDTARRPSATKPDAPIPVQVVGERDKHLGPRMDYARVCLRAEPSACFEIVDLVAPDDGARTFGFPETFERGFLDGWGVAGGAPRPGLRLVLQSAEHHPIDSSPNAFVEAGRDAARKLLRVYRPD